LPLVLAAALASVWWPTWAAAAACVGAAVAFNWWFVTPRGTFEVTLSRDVLLLATMLAVSMGITLLMARQRRTAALAGVQAQRIGQLYALSEHLRQADTAVAACEALARVLPPTRVACQVSSTPEPLAWGPMDANQRDGLNLCCREGKPLGRGTGRYDNQPAWYLPLRGLHTVQGAALLHPPADWLPQPAERAHAQALCDLLGQTLERLHATTLATQAARDAQAHALRSTLLTAVSHDHRTPLAAILGAASSLVDQGDRLSPAQRLRLATAIVDEASHLSRLTDNALQLARLDANADGLRRDWESMEELVGAVLQRVRARDPGRRIRARVAPHLPLVRCDAVLVVQMLENLLDNALKYSPADTPVEVLCQADTPPQALLLAVRDRGPGMPADTLERLFTVFERGHDARTAAIRGAGVGLALCAAVARAHGSTLTVRPRKHGGTSLELKLPVDPQPAPHPSPDPTAPTASTAP
jgi:two-component system sensor histidine kinase KdpD